MEIDDDIHNNTLDPVVVVALESLAHWVYEMHIPSQDPSETSHNLLNPLARSAAILTFETLKRCGYSFPPVRVRRWAIANGWALEDAQLLDDYAAGVIAGVRYHTGGAGISSVERLRQLATGRQPWIDPGRPTSGSDHVLSRRKEILNPPGSKTIEPESNS